MAYKVEDFKLAIPGSGGIITTIARRVGCTWHTARNFIDSHPDARQAYDDECESVLDLAESTVFKNIRDGDTQDAKWYLTKKGKDRGYGDSVAVTGPDGSELRIHVSYDADDQPEPAPPT